jgi:hypothetical protein
MRGDVRKTSIINVWEFHYFVGTTDFMDFSDLSIPYVMAI